MKVRKLTEKEKKILKRTGIAVSICAGLGVLIKLAKTRKKVSVLEGENNVLREENQSLRVVSDKMEFLRGENKNLRDTNSGLRKSNEALNYHLGKLSGQYENIVK